VNPTLLDPVPDNHGSRTLGWFLDKLENTDLHVINTLMVWHGEMLAH